MSILEKTITVEQVIDQILLDLWYADAWYLRSLEVENQKSKNGCLKAMEDFKIQAISRLILLNSLIFSGGAGSKYTYKNITIEIPYGWQPYLEMRELYFKHPE